MDSTIPRIDYGVLDSLEWSGKSHTLSSFLDQFGSSLPHVIKVVEGFHGNAYARTIDLGQILILHAIYQDTKILAKDAQNEDLLIPKDFQVKVEMIPKNSVEESRSVRELLKTFPKYFRVLEDIPSHDITSGSMFKIIRQKGYGYFESLQILSDGEEREVRLPLSLKGRFQALQDNREFFLDEVYAEEKDNIDDGTAVNVHFVKSSMSKISVPGLNVESLYELGTLRLVAKCETETVFASILTRDDSKILAVFPRDLEISVQVPKTNEHYNTLRQTIKDSQLKTLKRIERLNKLSLYKVRYPVRQFFQTEIAPPALRPIAKPRAGSVMDSSTQATVTKTRSNSSPPLPPKKPLEKKSKDSPKKSLKQALSVPAGKPVSVSDQNTKDKELELSKRKGHPSPPYVKQRPNYKPPPVPNKTPPPVPPKETKPSREKKEEILTSGQDLPNTETTDQNRRDSDPDPPPIPPPRVKRRHKTVKQQNVVERSVDLNYEKMDGLFEQDYEHMDRSWMDKSDATLEEMFGDIEADDEADGIECRMDVKTEESKARGREEKEQWKDKEMVGLPMNDLMKERADSIVVNNKNTKELELVPPNKDFPKDLENEEQRERADSVDYENTKELKLVPPKKEVPEDLENEEQRERADSVDYENTKELNLVPPNKDFTKDFENEEQRERADSVDYENTKELRLVPPKNDVPKDLENEEQRERADSVDYENTKELKLVPPKKGVPKDLENEEQRERADSFDYENTKELKLVPPKKGFTKDFENEEQRERADSVDYENTPEVVPPGRINTDEGALPSNTSEEIPRNTSLPCNGICTNGVNQTIEKKSNESKDVITLKSTQTSSKLESISEFSSRKEGKRCAKTEQFLKDLELGRRVLSDGDSTSKLEGTEDESSTLQSQDTSDGIYYTSMAENVAHDPSLFRTMAAYDDTTYMPMDGSNVDDLSIYENDTAPRKVYGSDDNNYEAVELASRTPRKTNQRSNDKAESRYSTEAYEQVDIILRIESLNDSTDNQGLCYESMDGAQVDESIPLSRCRTESDFSYEEVDFPLKPGSSHINIIQRERKSSEGSYEDVDFPITPLPSYLAKKLPEVAAPPTPPQRRKRKSNGAVDVKGEDKKDESKVLSSSPKSGQAAIQSEDFEDLDSLRFHMAVKDSEREMLFEKAKALSHKNELKQPPTSVLPKESLVRSQAESGREVSNEHVKSRPPAPPPRAPVLNYLDVEPKGKPDSKPFKKHTTCNYSDIVGKVKPGQSSKDDDMEYVSDIELHFFQKQNMEMEKRRKQRDQKKADNVEVSGLSNRIKGMEIEEDGEKLGAIKEESRSAEEVVTTDAELYLTILPDETQKSDTNKETEIPKTLAQIDSKTEVTKNGSQDSKEVITKPPPKKPIVKKKPSRDPPVTSQHPSHDSNNPITRHGLEKPAVAKKPLAAKRSLGPPPKPKRTFAAEFTHSNNKPEKQNILNTYDATFPTKKTSSSSNGKSSEPKVQPSSEDKVTPQRTKAPKPLPRRKSQT